MEDAEMKDAEIKKSEMKNTSLNLKNNKEATEEK